MVRRSKGSRQGTRHKLRKNVRSKGKLTITQIVKEFKPGEIVAIRAEPSIQKGMPHRRFLGRQAEILEKRGHGYVLKVKDGNKFKKVISLPVHLKRIKQ